ncbi:uncharacterized protein LOC143282323 [Babylonia areolata]|uniref:uncharacterized protein LOC143282323 n=1 Tax=Babylonia areolata TaxID=304850 RepID=UPI003FD4FBFB
MTEQNSCLTCAPVMAAVMVEGEGDTEADRVRRSVTLSVELTGDAIYLNCRQLVALPQRLFHEDVRHLLQRLYLQHNSLESLPSEIKSLQYLRELYLRSNRLEALPEELCELPHLETLEVSNNQLTGIPQSICRLHNLKRLRLARNKLSHLPPEVGGLHQLQALELSHNRLRRLPPELGGCCGLQQLSVDSNLLITLPRQLCHLTQLTEISASNNQLVSLPQDLGRMAALQAVYVDNNPFLRAMPASTLHKIIGFCGSGRAALPEPLRTVQQHVSLSGGQGPETEVPLPPEIRRAGHLCTNCVPMLLELALHLVFRLLEKSAGQMPEGEVPSDLQALLTTPTAHCQHCGTQVFVSAFPVVFSAQVETHSLLLLGLCCSAVCVRQCSLVVHLPLIYPRLEDLALALVVA